MSKPRFKTKKESPQISSVSSSLASSWKMAVPSQTTTSRRSQPSTWYCVCVVVCRSSSRLSQAKLSHWRLSPQIPLRMSKPRFKTKKESPQISSVSSLLASSWKMAEPSQTTTSRRSQPSTWCCVCVVVCRSSSRLSQAKLSLWKLRRQTPLRMSKPRFKTKKEFPQISSVSSSLASSWKMAVPCQITTSRRSQPSTWCCVCVVVCRSSSGLSQAKPSHRKLSPQTPLKMSKPRFKTKKESPQ